MSRLFDCADAPSLLAGMRLARTALGRGDLVVIPTDTVYGIAANAFSPEAVARLRTAKGRGRELPPPVLIANRDMLSAIAEDVPPLVDHLVEALWPGALTIVLHARTSLAWDLGDAHGTVAVRMPRHDVALELLRETGPLAVSSANRTGRPAARTAIEAEAELGEFVAFTLDAGSTAAGALASTIIDATALRDGGRLRVLRDGAIPRGDIEALVGADRFEVAVP